MNTFTIQLLEKIGDTLAFIALSLGAVLVVLYLAKRLAKSELYLSKKLFVQLVGVSFVLLASSCTFWGFAAIGESDKAHAAFFFIGTASSLLMGFSSFTLAVRR